MFGRFFLYFITSLLLIQPAKSQKRTVSFVSQDGVEIFADLLFSNAEYPYVVLFHQENSSRGEYVDIAQKLLNLKYNCLVVDLRVGSESNFVKNMTAKSIQKDYSLADCLNDVEASIDYAIEKSGKPVILFGSGFSASLCLVAAKNNKKVKAIVAFSPGDYLNPKINLKDELKNYDKKIFIGARNDEINFIKELLQPVANSLTVISSYESSDKIRGSLLLTENNKSSDKFWLDLLLFFKSLNS